MNECSDKEERPVIFTPQTSGSGPQALPPTLTYHLSVSLRSLWQSRPHLSRLKTEFQFSVFLALFFSLPFCPSNIFLPIHYLSPDEVGKLLFVPLPFLHSCFLLMLAEKIPLFSSFFRFKLVKIKETWKGFTSKRKSFLVLFTWSSVSDCIIQETVPPLSYHNITICTAITITHKIQHNCITLPY